MLDSPSPAARSIRDLSPNSFAIVMATGIVALALNAAGWRVVGLILFWVGAVVYAVLWALTAARCIYHRSAVRADLHSHARAPGFFTCVAATGMLGSGSVLLCSSPEAGVVLWVITGLLWVGFSYSVLPRLMGAENKPELEKGLSGTWLLTVVATQSVCVLGCSVAPYLPDTVSVPGLFIALCFWLIGGMLYMWLITLIFYRITFRPLAPADFTPPYWISMGAMAISTLGGVSLVSVDRRSELLVELTPFLKGLSLAFWATATWWLPLLTILEVWRYGVKRYPLTYDHGFWGAVFPLGMYAVCTLSLTQEFGLPFLSPLGETFAWVALTAWSATTLGLIRRLVIGMVTICTPPELNEPRPVRDPRGK